MFMPLLPPLLLLLLMFMQLLPPLLLLLLLFMPLPPSLLLLLLMLNLSCCPAAAEQLHRPGGSHHRVPPAQGRAVRPESVLLQHDYIQAGSLDQ